MGKRKKTEEREDKKVIGIVGACGGVGATYVASNLALAIAKKNGGAAYLETHLCGCPMCLRKPLTFYRQRLHNGIFPGRFADFFYMKLMGENTQNRVNLYKGVNWAVRREDSPCSLLTPEDIAGKYVIWDDPPIYGLNGAAADSVIADKLDLILCVARPDVEYMASGAGSIKKCFKEGGTKTRLIYNLINSAASLRAAEKYIGIKGDFFIWKDLPEEEKSIEKIAEYILTLY